MIKGLADYEQCECKLCNHDKAILVVYFNIIFNYNLLTYSLKNIEKNKDEVQKIEKYVSEQII